MRMRIKSRSIYSRLMSQYLLLPCVMRHTHDNMCTFNHMPVTCVTPNSTQKMNGYRVPQNLLSNKFLPCRSETNEILFKDSRPR